MKHLRRTDLEAYMLHDSIGTVLRRARKVDRSLTVQRWLRDSPAKRLLFHLMYSDLLSSSGLRLLDVGGGLSTVTRELVYHHRYHLVEIMAHDMAESVNGFCRDVPELVLHQGDWYDIALKGPYDMIIANDLFPNVDQRLELFLEKTLPMCRTVRLSLTYHNQPKFYFARRLDADEILCVAGWDGPALRRTLEKFADRIIDPDLPPLSRNEESLFSNGRRVCIVEFRGDLAAQHSWG